MKKIRHSHRLRIGSLEALEGRTLLSVVGPARQTAAPSAAIARADAPRAAGPLMTWKDFKATPTAPEAPSAVPTADATTSMIADDGAPPADVAPDADPAILMAETGARRPTPPPPRPRCP